MERRHTIDRMAADARQVSHAHVPRPGLVDQGQARDARLVPGVARAHLVEEAAVDLVHDLEVARQYPTKQLYRPLLQRLRQQRVVGVGKRPAREVPRRTPIQAVLVDQQAHQLRYRQRRMRVVHLDRVLVCEAFDAHVGLKQDADHVPQRAGHQEVLLPKPQHLAQPRLVVRVEDLGDGLGEDLLVHGAVVVAGVEGIEVERLDGLRLPQPQQVRGVDAVAEDRGVIGDALHHSLRHPAHPVAAVLVGVRLGAPAELHFEGDLGPRDLPWIAQPQPLVGALDLPAVANLLVEDAELVADAVADGRHLQGGERVHEARGEPPQAAVAQARLFLLIEQRVEVESQFRDRLPHLALHA